MTTQARHDNQHQADPAQLWHRTRSRGHFLRAAAGATGAALSAGLWLPTHALADNTADLETFMRSLGHLPVLLESPPTKAGSPTTTSVPGWDITTQPMTQTTRFQKVVMFGADQSVIWPGSVLQGGHIVDEAPAPVVLKRAPLTIAVLGLAPAVSKSAMATVNSPDHGTVNDAINNLLLSTFTGPETPAATPARIDVSMQQVYSVDHACAQLGINVHFVSGDVKAQMQQSFQENKASFAASVTQTYYQVAVSIPGPGAPYFDASVTVADAQRYMGPGNPPVFISSIEYGRRLALLIMTDKREESFNADIAATIRSASATAQGTAALATSSLVSNSYVHLLDIGGDVNAILPMLTADPGNTSAVNAPH